MAEQRAEYEAEREKAVAREDALREAEGRAEQAEATLVEQRAELEAERERRSGARRGRDAEARAEQAEAAFGGATRRV